VCDRCSGSGCVDHARHDWLIASPTAGGAGNAGRVGLDERGGVRSGIVRSINSSGGERCGFREGGCGVRRLSHRMMIGLMRELLLLLLLLLKIPVRNTSCHTRPGCR
jgi:hypothetical protein